jgi:hypothetical protein
MRDGLQNLSPGKLIAIQKWSQPETISHLRGFMGVTNYYSGNVPQYAELADLLTSKLSVNKEDGKRGSSEKVP